MLAALVQGLTEVNQVDRVMLIHVLVVIIDIAVTQLVVKPILIDVAIAEGTNLMPNVLLWVNNATNVQDLIISGICVGISL